MHEIYDKYAATVKFVKLDTHGEDMIPLSFTVKPDMQAKVVPYQSVKASYATSCSSNFGITSTLFLVSH